MSNDAFRLPAAMLARVDQAIAENQEKVDSLVVDIQGAMEEVSPEEVQLHIEEMLLLADDLRSACGWAAHALVALAKLRKSTQQS